MAEPGLDDVFSDDITVPATDGYPLAATLFLPRGAKRHAVLINSATAVPRRLKARCYSSLAQMLGTRSLTQRLAQVLLHLAHTYGFEEDETSRGITIAAAFTHAEIANLIGGTRQWVTISLNRLQKSGVLSQKRGLLVIHRIDLLSAAASAADN